MRAAGGSDDSRKKKFMVRKAVSGDLEQYARNVQSVADEGRFILTEKVTPERKDAFRRSFRDRDSLVSVAEVDEGRGKKRRRKIVGSLALMRYVDVEKARHVRVLGMQVIESYREMGIGTEMMDRAEVGQKATRCREDRPGVFSNNPRALHLYQKFGFELEGVRNKHYNIDGKQVDEIDMALFLK